MWFHSVIMWFNAFADKYFPSRCAKITKRLAEIDDDLARQKALIKADRERLDKLTWFKPSFERHDGFTPSMIEQIKDEKRYRQHRVKVLCDEKADLTARLERFTAVPVASSSSRMSAYS